MANPRSRSARAPFDPARRRAVGAAAAAAALFMPTAARARAEAPAPEGAAAAPDVIVVGGGFAGLAAARGCRQHGYRVLLLEARDRLGGRAFSGRFAGHAVELGGTWIHWSQPFVWAEKERYGLDVVETPGVVPERMLLRLDGKVRELGEGDVAAVADAFRAYHADARLVFERPYDLRHSWERVLAADGRSAAEHLATLELSPLQRCAMDSLLAGIAHNTPDQLSHFDAMRWSALAGYGDLGLWMDAIGRFKFRDGTAALVERMLEDARPQLRLETPVARIEEAGGRVRVTSRRGETFEAAAAIVALPMNVLDDVEFAPALDAGVAEAARQRHTGLGIKVFARTRRPVGRLFMMAGSAEPLSNVFTYAEPEGHTVLVGFGADRGRLDVNDVAAVQAALRAFVPGLELDAAAGHDWVQDPWAQGTYASYRPGWIARHHAQFGRDRGRIFFGQGDHGDGWRGFIDGAIGEGVRAAERVAAALG